jgi:hypothetical protein
MRVEEVMSAEGFTSHGQPVKDEWITTSCNHCEAYINLGRDCDVVDRPIRPGGRSFGTPKTEYRCRGCGTTLVTVGPAFHIGRAGLTLGEWAIQTARGADLQIRRDH